MGEISRPAALNEVLDELVRGAQDVLGENFVGAYLQGSFALGDWDTHSDVDFLVVVQDLPDAALPALQALHGRIYDRVEPHWTKHLEGSYFPKELLRRSELAGTPLFYLDNTARELIWSKHDNTLVVRWVMREYGVTLAGQEARTLVDPVPPDGLRRETWDRMLYWSDLLDDDPQEMNNRWYQPYAVLSYCRMLYTLETGRVCSKPAGAAWAKAVLDGRWAGLIDRAWAERPNPSEKVHMQADPGDFGLTLEFIQYVLADGKKRSGQWLEKRKK